MDINPVILSIPLYFLLIGFELIYEAVRKTKLYRTNDAVSNISCGITSQITNALWGVLAVGLYQIVYQYGAIFQMPSTWWSYLILFIAVDFCYYWFHRASHEINFLWNTSHVVHHQSEDYNLSVALRQASFGGLFSMVFYLPLALLGFSAYAFLTVKGLNLIYQFWIHTEAIDRLPRWFEYLFNTPSNHRVHHGRDPKYIDKNHAGTLMIWDHLFGTYQKEEERPTYGVTKPSNTWNPVWANVMPIVDMGKQVIQTSGLTNKLKVLFYKPGWQPEELGGYQMAPEVDKASYRKYNKHPLKPLVSYILANFVLILIFTSYFLFTQNQYVALEKWLLAGYIVWSVAQLGLLMEQRTNWVPLEYVRTSVSAGLIVFFFGPSLSYLIIATTFLLGMNFAFWKTIDLSIQSPTKPL